MATEKLSSLQLVRIAPAWIDVARRHRLAVRVLEAETGMGKSFVAQSLFDTLAIDANTSTDSRAANTSYWKPGLTPTWPPSSATDIERSRKTVVPGDDLRDATEGNRLDLLWIGLPLGSIGQMDPLALILEQLTRCHFAAAAMDPSRMRRRAAKDAAVKTGTKLAAKGALTLVVGPLGPVIERLATGLYDSYQDGKSLRDIAMAWRESFISPAEEMRRKAREALVTVVEELQEFALEESAPLIIVLDDAHAATPELLEVVDMLAGLSRTDLASGEPDLARTTTFNPPEHGLSVLIVATTWPNESTVRNNGAFDAWIDDCRSALSEQHEAFEEISVAPIDTHDAIVMLAESGVPEEWAIKIAAHLGQPREGASLNALVLAMARAQIDKSFGSSRHLRPFDESMISQLSIAPTAHTEERRKALLRDHPGEVGDDAEFLLCQMSEFGSLVPADLVRRIASDAPVPADFERSMKILEQHRMAERLASNDYLPMIRLDVDLQAYLAQENHHRQPVRDALPAFLSALGETMAHEMDEIPAGPLPREDTIAAVIRRSLPLMPDGATLSPQTLALFNVSLSERMSKESLRLASQGRSRFASIAALRLAHRAPQVKEKLNILRPHASYSLRVAQRIATFRPDLEVELLLPHVTYSTVAAQRAAAVRPSRATEFLMPHAATNSIAAMQLARSHPEQADQLLEPHWRNDPNAAITLARLHPDRAEEVLAEHAQIGANAAMMLAAVRPDLAKEILLPHVDKDINAAMRLAEIHPTMSEELFSRHWRTSPQIAMKLAELRPDMSDTVLEPHWSRDSNVAIKLAERQPDRARELLGPHSATSINAAMKLAALEPDRSAEILRPHAERGNIDALTRLLEVDPTMIDTQLVPRARRDPNFARLLVKYRPRIARRILEHHAESSILAAVELARLVPGRAATILQRHAANSPGAAVELARLVPSLATEALEPHVSTSAKAAVELAQLRPERAVELLVPHATSSANAAVALAQLQPERAIELLEPHATSSANAAVALARLQPDRADSLLEPHVIKSADAARELAEIHPERRDELLARHIVRAPNLPAPRPDRQASRHTSTRRRRRRT